MNNFETVNVAIDQIDFDDRSYIITFAPELTALISSIQRVGLLHRPILEEKSSNRYRIVSGYKRLLALRQLNTIDCPAVIWHSQDSTPTRDRFLLTFYENLGTRQLNLIEIAHFTYKSIHVFGVSRQEMLATYFPLLKLGLNLQVLDRLLALNELEDYLKLAVINETITVDMALMLLKRAPAEQRALFDLFQLLHLGTNRQKDFFKLLTDLSAITYQSIPQLLQSPNIAVILEDRKLDHVLKAQRLREQLIRLRYPHLAQAEENFHQLKRSLKLPPNIILHPPPFFEGNRFKLELQFKDAHEFRKLLATLATIAETNQLETLTSLV